MYSVSRVSNLCFTAAIPGQKTYKLYEDHVTQAEAIVACEIEGGRLAVPMASINSLLKNFLVTLSDT